MKLTKQELKKIIVEELELHTQQALEEDLGGINIEELVTMLKAMAKMGANLSPILLALVPAVRQKVEPLLDKVLGINASEDEE